MRPLIVGEHNPVSADPRHALYPEPAGCAGHRLCVKVMGLRPRTYLRVFERTNLLSAAAWRTGEARVAAERITADCAEGRVIVLLGVRVAAAFGLPPYQRRAQSVLLVAEPRVVVVALPHPSGRNRIWNAPGAVETARALLRGALPDVPFGEADA